MKSEMLATAASIGLTKRCFVTCYYAFVDYIFGNAARQLQGWYLCHTVRWEILRTCFGVCSALPNESSLPTRRLDLLGCTRALIVGV